MNAYATLTMRQVARTEERFEAFYWFNAGLNQTWLKLHRHVFMNSGWRIWMWNNMIRGLYGFYSFRSRALEAVVEHSSEGLFERPPIYNSRELFPCSPGLLRTEFMDGKSFFELMLLYTDLSLERRIEEEYGDLEVSGGTGFVVMRRYESAEYYEVTERVRSVEEDETAKVGEMAYGLDETGEGAM
ncbi:MAG: hypothetical protein L6R39_004400 [Caloplaca ligustica]|nr:MAG: hypothetical protein L6R39_004400 [Caloplaca ligustica]